MPAPEVSAFGDGSHAPGAAGITVDGGGFGAFPGSVWIYENDDLTGNSDELTVNSWNDIAIDVDIPGSLNNAAGTRFLFVQREDLAWSNALSFTLETGAGTDSLSADDVEAASEVTTPVIGQIHALLADDAESASELTEPTLTIVTPILANDVEAAAQVSSPTLAQIHVLLANDVQSTSTVTSPQISSALPTVRSRRVFTVPRRRRVA